MNARRLVLNLQSTWICVQKERWNSDLSFIREKKHIDFCGSEDFDQNLCHSNFVPLDSHIR